MGDGATDRQMGGGAWHYRWTGGHRPCVHPLRSPAGDVLTVDGPVDHPWHHALWFAVKYVNGENFWEEYGDFGVVTHEGPPVVAGDELTGDLVWVAHDGGHVRLRERRRLTHVALAADAYAVDWDLTLVPPVDTVLDRTPFTTWGGYGGLTLRGRADWHDTVLLTSDGHTGDRRLGDRAAWCDLTGQVAETGRAAGVLMIDHPENPSFPTPWYASTRAATYGDEGWANFMNAAFLWDGPREVAGGEALRLRHRLVVHDGVWDAGRCHDAAERWLLDPTGCAGPRPSGGRGSASS